MTNNDTRISPILTLENSKGVYKVEVDLLNLAILKTADWDDALVKKIAGDCCGYRDPGEEVFRSDTRLEVLIALVESGNFL